MHLVTDLLIQGVHLDEVWRESEGRPGFRPSWKILDAADVILNQQQFIRNLRGQTEITHLQRRNFDEKTFEARLTGDRMTR